jgi:hypothetical protein
MAQHLDPTSPNHILVGLGGTGGKVLKAFRKRILQEFPDDNERNDLSIGYVYVDSTREMMVQGDPSFKVLGKDASFSESEFVDIKSVNLTQILDQVSGYPGLANVVKNGESMKNTLGEVGKAAGQMRRAGRILFAANCNNYISALMSQYQKVRNLTHKDSVNIHIFTGLAGGTGSGSIIDVISQTRKKDEFRHANIVVYAMVPELTIPDGCQAGRYHQNGYAALCELSALNVGVFLPCDVITGDQHIKGLDTTQTKQFGLMLYSNVNENGITVDSFSELPELLADTVFFRMFLQEVTGSTDDFLRSYSLENINNFCVEYNSKSKSNDKERARTKAINSFGIKRVVYPEERIIEHISLTVGLKILYQMQYNNFKSDYGYVQEPQKKDYKQLYLDDAHLREWLLDDSHLTLNEKIFETDKNFRKIEDFWDEMTQFNSYDDAKNNDANPLNFLKVFCTDKYNHQFRNKIGVEEYYQDKGKDELLKDQAAHIVGQIEDSLYTKWYEGSLSLNDLKEICNQILIYIRERHAKLEDEIADCDKKIEDYTKEGEDNVYEYTHLSLVQRATGRQSRLYADHQDIMKDLFIEKTKRTAKVFQQALLLKLRAAFEEQYSDIEKFIGILTKSMQTAVKKIADRNKKFEESGIDDLTKATIEVSEVAKMKKFEQIIVLDNPLQETYAGNIRKSIVGNKEHAHFSDLIRNINEDKIFDIFDVRLSTALRTKHDEIFAKDRILGINVLEQLHKLLDTDVKITNFARDIIQQSGVFLKLDDGEMKRSIPNNPDPVSSPETINRKTVLITLPEAEGSDELKTFANTLRNKLREGFGNNTAFSTLKFNTSTEKKNELTIISIKYCFPMRAISWLQGYEQEYKKMIEDSNEKNAREARILLHSEGDGSNLPGLMGEATVSLKDFAPYLFIAAATGIIKYGEDSREYKGWCKVEKDEFDSEYLKLISPKFTELINSDFLTEPVRDEIMEQVIKKISDTSLKVSERETLANDVKTIMRDYVKAECSSPESPKYQEYAGHARKAMEMISKYK